jgi:signal peptide peptidase SppA
VNLLSYLTGVWCVTEDFLSRIEAMQVDVRGLEVAADAGTPRVTRRKNVAVIPLHGVLEPRQTLMGMLMGGTSTTAFGNAFDAAVSDPQIGGILVDIDSPGGSAFGVQEVADKIRAARGSKPMVAVGNHVAGSGAYWIASQFDRYYVSPSSYSGSVGAFVPHIDRTAQNAAEGVKVEIIRADDSPHKVNTISHEPLTDDARNDVKVRLNATLDAFIGGVAAGRGVSTQVVRDTYGKGRVLNAQQAVSVGMADRIATFEEVAGRMLDGRIRMVRGGAQAHCVESWDGGIRAETARLRVDMIRMD